MRASTPRQTAYLQAYVALSSPTFGNSYQSALSAGYSTSTARNMTHLQPEWLSENIGQIAVIRPEEIMQELTSIIHNSGEPTIVRLKAMELSMRAYSMLQQRRNQVQNSVSLNIDLTQ